MEGPGTKSVQVTALLKPEAPAGLCFVAGMMVAFGATDIKSLPTACLCRHHSQRRQAQLRAHKVYCTRTLATCSTCGVSAASVDRWASALAAAAWIACRPTDLGLSRFDSAAPLSTCRPGGSSLPHRRPTALLGPSLLGVWCM